MNVSNIDQVIGCHRPLNESSSLPIALMNDNEICVTWFNYYVDQTEDEFAVCITKVCVLRSDDEIEKNKVNLKLTVDFSSFEEPEIEEEEYIELFEQNVHNFTYEKAKDLLVKAGYLPLLHAYEAVQEYLHNQQK